VARVSVKPKKKCCLSKPRCTRCPLRMLADGTLQDGYTVKRRMLVKVGKDHARDAAMPPHGKTKAGKRKKAKDRKKK
jgi:hypothetical protein